MNHGLTKPSRPHSDNFHEESGYGGYRNMVPHAATAITSFSPFLGESTPEWTQPTVEIQTKPGDKAGRLIS